MLVFSRRCFEFYKRMRTGIATNDGRKLKESLYEIDEEPQSFKVPPSEANFVVG